MKALVLIVAMLPAMASAQSVEMESDWIELVKGHRGAKMGVEVRDLVTDPVTGEQTVTVSIPKLVLGDTPMMEEVVVTGKGPQKREFEPLFPELEAQWVDDYDNDNYGLLVKLKKDQKIPFRLFFSSEAGVLDNSVKP